MDNPNISTSLNTPLDSSQTNVEKTDKSIWFIIFFVFFVFTIIFLVWFLIGNNLFKNKEISSLKTTIKCGEKGIEFNLISCKYLEINPTSYNTIVKFKRTDTLELEIKKLFVFVFAENNQLKFKETSTENLSDELETTVDNFQFKPKEFYVSVELDGGIDCVTSKIICSRLQSNFLIADAGINLTVNESSLVILNGSESYNPSGDLLTYNWTQISGMNVVLGNNNFIVTNFTAPEVSAQQSLIFRLTISDGNLSASDIVEIKVNDLTIAEIVYDISAPPPLPS